MRFSAVFAAAALVAGATAANNATVTEVVSSATAVVPVNTAAPYGNNTGSAVYPVGTSAPSGTISSPAATFTGAADKAFAASGAGLAAVFGFAAYIL